MALVIGSPKTNLNFNESIANSNSISTVSNQFQESTVLDQDNNNSHNNNRSNNQTIFETTNQQHNQFIQKMRDSIHLPPFLENIGKDIEKKMRETPNFKYPNFPEDKVISTELECFLQPESPREYSYSNIFETNNSNELKTLSSIQSLSIGISEEYDESDSDADNYDLISKTKPMAIPLTPANSMIIDKNSKNNINAMKNITNNRSNSVDNSVKTVKNKNSITNEPNSVIIETSSILDEPKHSSKHKKHHKHKHKHRHIHRIQRSTFCSKLSHMDHHLSRKVHELACGVFDYLFVFGAFVFGSKFMPITILLSIFIVNISGFLFTGIACTITVTITEFGKKYFARHRPDPTTFGPKVLDFRTRLTNFSFPSGDTAQAASYSTALYFLTNNIWLLLFIPNCAWSRIYFGCHYIGDCVAGALIGIIVPMILWAIIPHSALSMTQDRIEHWIYGL